MTERTNETAVRQARGYRSRYSIPPHVAPLLSWRGRVLSRSPANVATLLRFAPWASVLTWDARTHRVRASGKLPWHLDARGWNEIDDAVVQRLINREYGFSVGVSTAARGVELFAQLHAEARERDEVFMLVVIP